MQTKVTTKAQNTLTLNSVYLLSFVFAFCSISYELLIANTISRIAGLHVLWQCLTIGVYLASLGWGAFLSEKVKDEELVEKLFDVEIYLSLSASLFIIILLSIFTSIFFHLATSSVDSSNQFYIILLATILTQSITILIGTFSGYEVPLLIRYAGKISNRDKTNFVLSSNYFGALAGTLLFSLWISPTFDRTYSMIILASINMFVCVYLLVGKITFARPKHYFLIFVFLLVNISIGINRDNLEQAYLKTFYLSSKHYDNDIFDKWGFFDKISDLKDIERIQSKYQYIDIIDFSDYENDVLLTLDTDFQFLESTERSYHEAFAHIPSILYRQEPKNVLVLGAGDGLLIRELIKYESIENIRHIELDPIMLRLGKENPWLNSLNGNSLADPRVHSTVEDAFYFLRNAEETYDAIYIDFPYPYTYDTSRLYSLEFYANVLTRLSDGGYFVFDSPVIKEEFFDKSEEKFQRYNHIIFNTLDALNLNARVSYSVDVESFITVRKKRNSDLNYIIEGDYPIKLNIISQSTLDKIKNQKFPYEKNTKWLNSVFKPKLVMTPKKIY